MPAHLLAALLKLQATFASDAGAAAAGREGQLLPPEHLARLLCAMGGPRGLPLLCQLAADVAAAGSGSQPAAATGCSNGGCVNGCCGGRCSTSFGQFAWRELNDEWVWALSGWGSSFEGLTGAGFLRCTLDSSSCAAALRATEALLRLAPLLPSQPAEPAMLPIGAPKVVYTSARVAAEVGGQLEARSGRHGRLCSGCADCGKGAAGRGLTQRPFYAILATEDGLSLARHLLEVALATPPEAVAGAATAAFHCLATACRYTQAVGRHLQRTAASSGGASGGSGAMPPAAGQAPVQELFVVADMAGGVAAALDLAAMAALRLNCAAGSLCASASDQQELHWVQRWVGGWAGGRDTQLALPHNLVVTP